MQNISLKQIVYCDTNKSRAFHRINCTHWVVENGGKCAPYCTLKLKNVSFNDCSSCDVRIPLVENVQPNIQSNVIKDMQSLIPQNNLYTAVPTPTNNDQSFLSKAAQYSKVEGSQLLTGKVSSEVFEKRKALCMGCPRRNNFKPDSESIGWCSSCGCSAKNPRAALSHKLWMPDLECPLKKFPKEVGEGFNATDALDSVKGIIQSVGDLFKKKESDEEIINDEKE
tara:strand:+ start:3881 stop:4555 length:675 start_codon:yes stop_codon:yes gene_type:complete